MSPYNQTTLSQVKARCNESELLMSPYNQTTLSQVKARCNELELLMPPYNQKNTIKTQYQKMIFFLKNCTDKLSSKTGSKGSEDDSLVRFAKNMFGRVSPCKIP